MPSLIPLQNSIVYGPVRSRRLGRSLGVNLFPADRKLCSFDCIYCHFGGTTDHVSTCGSCPVPGVTQVLGAIEEHLRSESEFEFVTLSGNGEPTLYPAFTELVPRLKTLIRELRPSVKLVLLSNSTTATDPAIRQAIGLIDVPILKLDAGDQATFEALNRPCPGLLLEGIIDGLTHLAGECRITLQAVMIDGPVCNSAGGAFDRWIAAVRRIRPAAIQLYTTDRPVADQSIRKLTETDLESIAGRTRELTGIDCRAYY